MTDDLSELAAVIGEEVSLGRELLDNLAAQREAIFGWQISDLIERIESRESLFSSLAGLERRRKRLVGQLAEDAADITLREILADNPSAKDATALERLQKDARRLYTKLQTEEKSLLQLMENLLDHIHEALSPLSQPQVALYGRPAAARVSSGLIQGKI
ncbi:MAG TPA: flagellar export chaperone FlgN [Verrucomicrobiae bacterium]|jgi:hypothetical protein|nr:flagellar export chaperone FlgN [Verrucomicrobiae bacterium]